MKSLGLALSGGGYRGIAHIGVLRALEEYNVQPDIVAGTSAGAIVGALYAAGCSITDMLRFWEEEELFQFGRFAFGKPGLVDTEKMIGSLEKYITQKSFEELHKKLRVTATDIIHAKLRIFDSGPLIKPIIASASFPIIFTPTEIEGELYMDGGILNNFPVQAVKNHCDVTIGVNVSPLRQVTLKDLDGFLEISQRVFELGSDTTTQAQLPLCDVYICPQELSMYGTFDPGKVEKIFEVGYFSTLEQMDKILALIKGYSES
ncbi:MAG: patatin-like phospholipase family protein [Bacteroidia bacterium]|nr:patatin-like phospholipase family protein [Bacteroidia bacterium]